MENAVCSSSNQAPIFIVGPPRSGTSLLSAIIGSHSAIACGPETDLFRALPIRRLQRIENMTARVEQAVQYLDEIRYPDGKSIAAHFALTNEQVRSVIKGDKDFVKSVYSAVPEAFARAQGKRRWAEKTPRHLFYLDTIRKLYPSAMIIRIVRDPRDSIPSVIKNIGLSTSYVGEFYRWLNVYTKSSEFFSSDKDSITVRYEDLVTDTECQVKRICDFIEEEYEPKMLERKSAGLVRVSSETWKSDIDKKITADNIYAWKRKMDPDIATAASLICSEALVDLNYPDAKAPEKELVVFPLGENFGAANEQHIIACAKKGLKYRPYRAAYPDSISQVFRNYPDTLLGDIPLGKKTSTRIVRSALALVNIVYRRITGNPVVVDPAVQLGIGSINKLLGKVALFFGRSRSLR
ncbi:sulfotransferase [Microbulbifer agarilyticus]|uniref:sulfotransferase family protein n=1 Tax=Microbulbifer agarilyticus TaxID=260552 RepID=UPI001C94D648|nr:sulfotransferase [Microbulbifer agarilyticus]MBY6190728.1 sulfotransferase [Microbulbifer agarilyticus]